MSMSKSRTIMDHYPVGMSECDHQGIFGDCGEKCPVYQRGECEHDIEEKMYKLCSDLDEVQEKSKK